MSSINKLTQKPVIKIANHNGLVVKRSSNEVQLERMVLACMLWENNFYVDGKSQADILASLVKVSDPSFVAKLAIDARTVHNLRHVPLLLCRELARNKTLKAETLNNVIQRADEIGEFLAIYWKDKKTPISSQVKKGLALAFNKFNEYHFAKWDKNSASVKLRDAMFMVHPKPANIEQEQLFKKIADKALQTPDTWETQLSAGADKCATFTRLMNENKLGALAFMRNLRNMLDSGVSSHLIQQYSEKVNVDQILPFRYIAAKNALTSSDLGFGHNTLESMMLRGAKNAQRMQGKTILLVDVSGSMDSKISDKSDLTRTDAACALAMLCAQICDNVVIYTFSTQVKKVDASSKGFALVDKINKSQSHGGTDLRNALSFINANEKYDRLMVFTDEQSSTKAIAPQGKGYIINVAAYQNGINHEAWTLINGFSESVIKYIQNLEVTN